MFASFLIGLFLSLFPYLFLSSLFQIRLKQSWVGFMLMNQPFYVGGIDDVEKAKGNAFGAAGLFFFIFLISMVHLIMDSMKGGGVVRTTVSAVHDDGFDGWTGQRQTNGNYGEVPTFQDFPEEHDRQVVERVGFLS